MTTTTRHGHDDDSSKGPASPRWELRLAILLSVIAGMVDLIGFLSVGNVFPAHITGNLVIVSAAIVRDLRPAQVLVIPVFIAAIAATWLLAKNSGRQGRSLNRLLLTVQFLLLASAFVFAVASPSATSRSPMAVAAVILAVCAMACQYALLRLTLSSAPSTAVMTGNLTSAILALLDSWSGKEPPAKDVTGRLMKSLYPLLGFLTGCIVAALAVFLVGDWSWALPAALAALAILLR